MPKPIEKVAGPAGGLQWDERITQLVLELLSHRTPPGCIGPNIFSVVKCIFNDHKVV